MYLKIKTDPCLAATVVWLPYGKAMLSVHPELAKKKPAIDREEPTAGELLDAYLVRTDDELATMHF
jgi:hypothetical protein